MTVAEKPLATSTSKDLAQRHQRAIFPCVSPYYSEPIALVRGEGSWVWDADERRYLDFFGGILTTGIGHCHPRVVGAVTKQAERLGHVSSLYLNEPQVVAAEQLAGIAPEGLDQTLFTNSGTEAIETAVLLACQFTERLEIITVRHAYSGRSILATNLTAHAPWRPLASTVAGIKHAAAPYRYRSAFPRHASEEEFVDYLARDLEELIDTTTNGRPAALLVETILGVGGFVVPPPAYFSRVAEIIRGRGGLFICDEVQTGFGRTGDKWFGIEHWDVAPDIMVTAKGIASGLPAAATLTRAEIAAAWSAKTISTFGGNPISMAALSATIDVMQEEDVPRRSTERGSQLRSGLEALGAEHAWIGEVRGMGLMQALEIVVDRESRKPDADRCRRLLEAARAEGLLIGVGGLHGNVIRMGPSMLMTAEEVDEGLSRLARACASAC